MIPENIWRLVVPLITLCGATASVFVFWPALWTPDTLLQYQEAASGRFTDHHPPLMAAFWRVFVVEGAPNALIALQIALYWFAAFFLLWNAPRKSPWALLWLLFPTSIALIGVIWKDAQMAIVWAAGWTLLLLRVWRPKWRIVCTTGAAALIAYGSLIRYNAFVAVPPLVLLLLLGKPWFKSLISTMLAYAIVASATLLTLTWLDYSVLKATSPRTAQLSLPIFDLAGITAETHADAFPFQLSRTEEQQLEGCYKPAAWDTLYYNGSECRWIMDRMRDYESSGHSIASTLISGVSSHPAAYIQHRLNYSNQFFCIAACRVNVNLASYRVGVGNIIIKLYLLVLRPLSQWLFAPINALIAGAWMGWVALRRRGPEQPIILGAVLSAELNLLSYVPFGVASDQRYAYPSFVLLAFAASAMLCSNRRQDA